MALPPLDNEESEDERSQTYSSNANLELDNGQQHVPLAGKGPTMVGMIFKSIGTISNFVDLIMDFLLVHYFLTKTYCQQTSPISPGTNSTEIREVQSIDLNYTTYGYIALSIIIIPSIIMSTWNFYIFWAEKVSRGDKGDEPEDFPTVKKCFLTKPSFYRSPLMILVPAFAVVSRSLRTMWFGFRYRRSKRLNEQEFFWAKWVAEKQDLNTIQVVESTLEQFPQMVLVLYVITIEIQQGCDVGLFQWIKIAGSCLGLCLSVGMMKENQELKEGDQYYEISKQYQVLIVTMVWQFMTIFIRAYLIAHMMIMFPLLMLGALLIHWVVFFVFTQIWHNTYLDNFDDLWEISGHTSVGFVHFVKLMFDILVSLMLTVTWVSFFDTDKKSTYNRRMAPFRGLGTPGLPEANKRRMIIYYVIITIENAVMYCLWYWFQVLNDINWHAPVEIDGETRTINTNMFFTVFLPVGYVFGIIGMIIYYSVCHPVHTRQDVEPLSTAEDYPLTLADGRVVFDEVG